MKILLINQDWFADEFRAAGHEVHVCGYIRNFEIKLEIPLLHIDTIIKRLHPFSPDRIIVYDESSPLLITGLDETSIPTIFYSVDTHHHSNFHKYLAHVFDATLIAQKDYIPEFRALGTTPEWFPLWASRFVESSNEKKFGACFVGNLDSKLNPERVAFFEALKNLTPIHLTRGAFWTIFPVSEIVVNQTVKGDLNFRVFEAMMCGALLLTEKSGNSLFDLFKEGVHLATYEKNNAANAAEVINYYLSNQKKCRDIAHAGREEILAHHLPAHRASRILEILETLQKIRHPMRSFGMLVNFSLLGKTLYKNQRGIAAHAFASGLKAAETGLALNETFNGEIACNLILSALLYDEAFRSTSGEELILKFKEAHPQVPVLTLAHMRTLLNRGKREEAVGLAKSLSSDEPSSVFEKADKIICAILELCENK